MNMPIIQTALKYAWCFVGTPYRWGGDDPMAGFDCSGFCIEILKGVGKLPRKYDTTAAGLFDAFKKVELPQPGCLVFWHNSDKSRIIHVEFCIDSILSLGASGGGSRTVTVGDAIKQNAFIKLRPFRGRHGIAGFVDPFS